MVLSLASQICIATLFAVAVASKVRSRTAIRSFASSIEVFGVRRARAPAVAAAAVALESAIVIAVLAPGLAGAGLWLATATLTLLTVLVAALLRRGVRAPCRCFGASARPMGRVHVARNAIAAIVAAAGALLHGAGPSPDPTAIALGLGAGLAGAFLLMRMDDVADLFRPSSALHS